MCIRDRISLNSTFLSGFESGNFSIFKISPDLNYSQIDEILELIDQFNAGADITEDLESSVNLAVNEIKGRLT